MGTTPALPNYDHLAGGRCSNCCGAPTGGTSGTPPEPPPGCFQLSATICIQAPDNPDEVITCIPSLLFYKLDDCGPDLANPLATWAHIGGEWTQEFVPADCPITEDVPTTCGTLCLNGTPYTLTVDIDGRIIRWVNEHTLEMSDEFDVWPPGSTGLTDFVPCVEDPVGLEIDMPQLGCVYDDDCELAGKVFIDKTVDEATGEVTHTPKFVAVGSTDVVDYDPAVHGAWSECGACEKCEPAIGYATADDLGSLPAGHHIDAYNPTCCPVEIVTSAGSFIVPAGTAHDVTFECPVTVISAAFTAAPAEGRSCTPADVTVTVTKRQ